MTSAKLFAVVPMKNEARRCLESCLLHLANEVQVDGILVLDDGSEDESVDLAFSTLRNSATDRWSVVPRPDEVAPFSVDEAEFRNWVLHTAVETFSPRPNIDWMLVNDADEFIVSSVGAKPGPLIRDTLDALDIAIDALLFGLDELWQLDPPMKRMDKAWGNQRVLRMFRYREQPLEVRNLRLACGSLPMYAHEFVADLHVAFKVVHAGYVEKSCREAKYRRYLNRPGHSSAHIDSILDTDTTLVDVPYCPEIEYREVW